MRNQVASSFIKTIICGIISLIVKGLRYEKALSDIYKCIYVFHFRKLTNALVKEDMREVKEEGRDETKWNIRRKGVTQFMKGYIILAILLTFYNYRYDTKVKLLLHCKWQNLLVSHALNLLLLWDFESRNGNILVGNNKKILKQLKYNLNIINNFI